MGKGKRKVKEKKESNFLEDSILFLKNSIQILPWFPMHSSEMSLCKFHFTLDFFSKK